MTSVEDLLAAGPRQYLIRNGVPTDEERTDRQRAHALILEQFGTRLASAGVDHSPLGVEWTDVFDVHLAPGTSIDPAVLSEHSWIALDPLWRQLEKNVSATSVWAVVADGRVLASARFGASRRRDPVETILERVRVGGEVRLREMLELRALARVGHNLPASSRVLQAAADIESNLGSRDLVRWTSGRRLPAPVALPEFARTPRRFLVAVSGVDGAGKTGLTESLANSLARSGVPVTHVWLRPGMGLGVVAAIAARVKRALGVDPRPGIGLMAAEQGAELRSRRGAIGWVWSMLVTITFVLGVRRQHVSSRGVVLWDRHVLDALTTLDFVYGGVNLTVQRSLIRRLLPAADRVFYLDVPVDVALERKPADMIGEHAVRRQLDAYEWWLPKLDRIQTIDARRPAPAVAMEVFRRVVAPGRTP